MNTSRVIATCFALAGFAATAIVGVYVGNPAALVLGRAILVMIAAYVVGRLLGGVMARAISHHVTQYKQSRPLPQVEVEDANASTQPSTVSPAGEASNA